MTSFIAKKMLLLVYKMWPSQDETMGVTCESFHLGLPLTIFPKIRTLPEDNKLQRQDPISWTLFLENFRVFFQVTIHLGTENVLLKVTF